MHIPTKSVRDYELQVWKQGGEMNALIWLQVQDTTSSINSFLSLFDNSSLSESESCLTPVAQSDASQLKL